jgi:hypothetical protein
VAIGDDAVSAGIDLTPGNGQASDIDLYINRLADEVARRTKFTSGSTALAIRQALQITAGNTPTTTADVQTDLDFLAVQKLAKTGAQYDADFADRDAKITHIRQGNLFNDAYHRGLGGTRRALFIQDDGVLGFSASTERYKKFVRPEDVTDEQILMLSLVSYQWKAAIAVDDRREMGLIAERVEGAGLGWACFYGPDGVEGLNYEMVALAMLPAVQRLIARVSRLEDAS